MTHYVLLSNFGNYHFSDPVLSLPLLIFLEYIKAKSTPFHPHIVLYEPLSDKGFLFNHLTIITPKQSSVIPLISPTMLLFLLLLLLLCFETANMIDWIPPASPHLLHDHVHTPHRGQNTQHDWPLPARSSLPTTFSLRHPFPVLKQHPQSLPIQCPFRVPSIWIACPAALPVSSFSPFRSQL